MSEIFDIIPKQKGKARNQPKIKSEAVSYNKLQAQFLTTSFGYYTIKFAQMITQEASRKSTLLKGLSINKILRQIVKKYLLSDLELVYVGHIANLLNWNITQPSILNNLSKFQFQIEGLLKENELLVFFLNLIAFFIKKFIGQLQEYKVIVEYLNDQSKGIWEDIYNQWLSSCPKSIFRLSPRQINTVYSQYSRNCQQQKRGKDYNRMVDQIMELSTTYAMIPGEIKETKKRKKQNMAQYRNEEEKQQQIQQVEPYLFGRKIFKADEVSQIDFFKQSQIKNQFSEISNQFMSNPRPVAKNKIKLGHKGPKQSQVNNNVTDFFSKKKNSELVIAKRYTPQSTIGFIDPIPIGFFDSKLCSSGSEIIPYQLRSNSNIFRSKLFQ